MSTPRYRNHYECSCGEKWTDDWECECDDRCPDCNDYIEPFDSKNITHMNYPALNLNRYVIFDPCYAPGSKLMDECAEPRALSTPKLGIAHDNPKGVGVNLIRTPLNEAFPLLEQLGAQFDLIVSEVPAGTIPAKGLPKPPKVPSAVPAGRKLFLSNDTAVDAPIPQIDHGYAVWLVTNALLTPFGEALLRVTDASWELIKRDPNYSRVWCYCKGAEFPTVDLYVARDHRPLPGEAPPDFGVLGDPHLGTVRGQRIGFHNQNANHEYLFNTVKEELLARKNGATDNLRLDGGKLRVSFRTFQVATGLIPQSLVNDIDNLRNRTLVDLAVMRDTRDRTRAILADKRLVVAPGILAAFDEVCQQMVIQSAPFNRPSPVQLVAWLDEQEKIECIKDFKDYFVAGEKYAISTRVITGQKIEFRHRPGFKKSEEVLVTGQEVAVFVHPGGKNFEHVFTQFPITERMNDLYQAFEAPGAAHTLNDLLTNFKMPEVKDIAEADPKNYLKFVKRLRALETNK